MKVSTTTICGTDIHIWRAEYPVAPGRIVGHEPVGVIHELGEAVRGYEVGQRVVVGAITPCGACYFCQHGDLAQCAGYEDEWQMIGGWRLGNSMDGVQSDYFRVPYAQVNLAVVPDELTDEQVMFVTDIASTGISAAETGEVGIGDVVVVYAQGPIGLCASAGARLRGAALVIGVDMNHTRLEMAREMGVDVVIDPSQEDPVQKVKSLTGGRGADVAIEALGLQETFENALRSVRPGGVVSSLGVYGHDLGHPARGLRLRHRRHRHPLDAVPRRQGAHARADGHGGQRPHRPGAADHPPLRPRPHRGRVRAVRQPAGRRDQGGADPLTPVAEGVVRPGSLRCGDPLARR